MTRYVFNEIKRGAKKRVACEGCGKRMNRQTTFSQTLNPFNKNAAGNPKSSREIWEELGDECREWEAAIEGHRCGKCQVPESA